MRRIILLLVLAGMFCHALGVAGRGALADAGEEAAHALLHWSESAHHHGDSGSHNQDSAEDAMQHVLADNSLTAPTLCPALGMYFGTGPAPRPRSALATCPPNPFPDQLQRPPRTTA